MPYGQYSPLLIVARPLVSSVVPFACRLSPLHPGYVITVCAIALRTDASSSTAELIKDNILGISGAPSA